MEADLAIVLVLLAGFLLGIFRGPVRQLLALGALAVTLVISAALRGPVGNWVALQAPDYSREYAEMLGFGLSFIVLFGAVVAIVQFFGPTTHLTRRPTFDAVLGGILGLVIVLLTVAALMIVLDSYYAVDQPGGGEQLSYVTELHAALNNSAIARSVHDTLVPLLVTVLGVLLPSDVTAPRA